jgi:hypothetical protein
MSDKNLHQDLAAREYERRDALVAEEILRRRHQERAAMAVTVWDLSEPGVLAFGFGSK